MAAPVENMEAAGKEAKGAANEVMPAWGAQARTPPPVGMGEPRPEEVGGATQLE